MLFLFVTAAQIALLFLAFRFESYRLVGILYWPVGPLTQAFIRGRSEGPWEGLVFIPPLVLFYSLVVSMFVGLLGKRHGR